MVWESPSPLVATLDARSLENVPRRLRRFLASWATTNARARMRTRRLESKLRHFLSLRKPVRPWLYRPYHCRRPCSYDRCVQTLLPDVVAPETHRNSHTWQARSQDLQKGEGLRGCLYERARLGGPGGMLPQEIFMLWDSASETILGQKQSRTIGT